MNINALREEYASKTNHEATTLRVETHASEIGLTIASREVPEKEMVRSR